MPHDYRPHPREWKPGTIPKPGQLSTYVDDDGNKFQAVITWVDPAGPSSDGKYIGLGAERFKPGANALVNLPGELGNPVSTERNGWLGVIASAEILYDPCPPPLP
jgi:hypothetical protein